METLNRSNVNSVIYGIETITSLRAKIWKFLPNDYKGLTSYQLSNPKLKIGEKMNALAYYANRISRELVLFDWTLFRQINVYSTLFFKKFCFIFLFCYCG